MESFKDTIKFFLGIFLGLGFFIGCVYGLCVAIATGSLVWALVLTITLIAGSAAILEM